MNVNKNCFDDAGEIEIGEAQTPTTKCLGDDSYQHVEYEISGKNTIIVG